MKGQVTVKISGSSLPLAQLLYQGHLAEVEEHQAWGEGGFFHLPWIQGLWSRLAAGVLG